MEIRCGARRSFEKPRVEAPPRLQVIGFDVSPRTAAAEASDHRQGLQDMVSSATAPNSYNELSPSLIIPKPASSPRSALQQLLLVQSPPSTSPTSPNHRLPPPLPSSSSSQSDTQTLITAGLRLPSHKPPSSSPISSNQNSTSGLLQPATTSPPAAPNQKWPTAPLLQPSTSPSAANQKWPSGSSKPQSPPSAHHSNPSSGRLKSLLQSECATSNIPANQSSRTSLFSSLSQSQYASSSSAGNQMISPKPGTALIKENYEAFFQIKQTRYDIGQYDAKAHEEVINDQLHHASESKKSSWFHDDADDDDEELDENDVHPYAADQKFKKSSWKGVQKITEHSLGNEKSRKSSRSEENSKKSSLFMFIASSPAPEFHHHHHPAEHNATKYMDFLSSCHLCRRLLGQGQDVFMYSGDKAFCSMECRYQQIVIDERKEKGPPPIIRSGASPVFHHTSVTASTTHHPIMINKPHFINTAAAA